MVGMGMIFDETYRPVFESLHRRGLFDPAIGDVCAVELAAVATRTGHRAEAYRQSAGDRIGRLASYYGPNAVAELLEHRGSGGGDGSTDVDFVCVATPDDRHFAAARAVLSAGKHVLIEKPSVLSLAELDELDQLARRNGVLAKVVYHKLLDPDHKKLRTLVADGELRHVNNGYCSLLEPKAISAGQFAEWIRGRNPGTYVAVHYIKLIDFTLRRPAAERRMHRPARARRPGRRPDLGLDATAPGLRLRRRPRGGVRHSHQLGHARQFPRLRRAGSAIPLRQRRVERAQPASAASNARSKAARRWRAKSR